MIDNGFNSILRISLSRYFVSSVLDQHSLEHMLVFLQLLEFRDDCSLFFKSRIFMLLGIWGQFLHEFIAK
jgi:hypothetical protein